MIQRIVDIGGMHCAACVQRVEDALHAIPDVTAATINLVTNRAMVDAPESVSDDAIRSAVANAGYTATAIREVTAPTNPHELADRLQAIASGYRRDLLLAAPFASVVLILSMGAMVMHHAPSWLNTVLFIMATPVMFAGRSMFRGAWNATRNRTATMDTLVTLGTGTAFITSVVATLAPSLLPSVSHPGAYFDSASTIIALVLLGKWLESRAKRRTAEALTSLLELHPSIARVRRQGEELEIPASDVVVSDTVIIRPGERVSVDGSIITGTTSVDESMLTGESMPVVKTIGDTVIGGTLNTTGMLVVRASAVGSDTVLAGIIRAVERTQASKAPLQRMADSISAVFVPIVVVIALLTFATWMIVGGDNATSMALTSTIAVLIIACPCALGLATPAAIIVGSGRAARNGILFTHAEALERLRDVSTIIVDKTGTLTSGTPRVHDAVVVSIDETELAPYVQAAERGSEHPLAFALLQWASARMPTSVAELSADDVTAVPGRGTVARFGDTRVRIGNAAFMEESMFLIPPALQQAGERFASQGWASIYVSRQRTVVACIAVADELRATSRDTVRALIDAGITVVMATGDHEAPARAIAAQAGITTVLHNATPLEKHEEIRRRQALGECVAMVGDGINDAPALAQADVGIAIGSGTDVAKNTADITLMRSDLTYVLLARRISQDTVRSIKQNLFFAFVYNVVGIPLAAGAMYPLTGLEFSPMIAAAAMSLSSVTVLANALRQRLSSD